MPQNNPQCDHDGYHQIAAPWHEGKEAALIFTNKDSFQIFFNNPDKGKVIDQQRHGHARATENKSLTDGALAQPPSGQ